MEQEQFTDPLHAEDLRKESQQETEHSLNPEEKLQLEKLVAELTLMNEQINHEAPIGKFLDQQSSQNYIYHVDKWGYDAKPEHIPDWPDAELEKTVDIVLSGYKELLTNTDAELDKIAKAIHLRNIGEQSLDPLGLRFKTLKDELQYQDRRDKKFRQKFAEKDRWEPRYQELYKIVEQLSNHIKEWSYTEKERAYAAEVKGAENWMHTAHEHPLVTRDLETRYLEEFTIPALRQFWQQQIPDAKKQEKQPLFDELIEQIQKTIETESAQGADKYNWADRARQIDLVLGEFIYTFLKPLFQHEPREIFTYIAAGKIIDGQGESPHSSTLDHLAKFGSDSSVRRLVETSNHRTSKESFPAAYARSWQIARQSPIIKEVLNKDFDKIDQKIYTHARTASFSAAFSRHSLKENDYKHNQQNLDLLASYQTPRATRDLLTLLLTADQSEALTAINTTLSNLAKKEDWPKLLRETIERYPELQPYEEYFVEWNHTGHYLPHEIPRGQSQEQVIKKMLKDEPNNIRWLSARLSIEDLFVYLEQKNKITPEEIETLKLARTIDQSSKFESSLRNFLQYSTYADIDFHQRNLLRYATTLNRREPTQPLKDFLHDGQVVSQCTYKLDNDPQEYLSGLLTAATELPQLNHADQAFVKARFIKTYKDPSDIDYLKKLYELPGVTPETIGNYALSDKFLGYSNDVRVLARSFVLAHPEVLTESVFSKWLVNYPELLQVPESVDLLKAYENSRLTTIDPELLQRTGTAFKETKVGAEPAELLFRFIQIQEQAALKEKLNSQEALSVDKQTWVGATVEYLNSLVDDPVNQKMTTEEQEKLKAVFESLESKNAAQEQLENRWSQYLEKPGDKALPIDLQYLSHMYGEIGEGSPLSQIESLLALMESLNTTLNNKEIPAEQKTRLAEKIAGLEAQATRQRWSNSDRADVRKIEAGITEFSPQVATISMEVLSVLPPADAKTFTREILPLYRTWTALLSTSRERNKSVTQKASEDEIRALETRLGTFREAYDMDPEGAFVAEHEALQLKLVESFKAQFGLIKLPESFDTEAIKSLKNVSVYLGNLARRGNKEETILGAYLGLMLNKQWDNFRAGEPIDWQTLVEPVRANQMAEHQTERTQHEQSIYQPSGLAEENLLRFKKELQTEATHIALSNIQTIDAKLLALISSLEGLRDPDLYPNQLDKDRLALATDFPSKMIGKTVSDIMQSLLKGTPIAQGQGSDIQARIQQIINTNGLPNTPDTLKEHFQKSLKPFTLVGQIFELVEENSLKNKIDDLHELLTPPIELIPLFQRLGEDFNHRSGAYALPQDLDYLTKLITENRPGLNPEEIASLTTYIGAIRQSIEALEENYASLASRMTPLKKIFENTDNQLLKDKLTELTRLEQSGDEQVSITSNITGDLNVIIENIRECLSCTRNGCNNDTDLTFGEGNKFFITSRGAKKETGSVADQILFVEPISDSIDGARLGFVMDRLYGTRAPDLLLNHIEVAVKKITRLKQLFPDARLALVIPRNILSGAASNEDGVQRHFENRQDIRTSIREVTVNVVTSGYADHYIEFGGDARSAGERTVDAIVFEITPTHENEILRD